MAINTLLRAMIIYMLVYSTAFAEIRQSTQLCEVLEEVKKSSNDTLVIFDVDFTLIQPRDYIFSHHAELDFENFNTVLKSKYNNEEVDDLLSLVWQHAQGKTVEENTLDTLRTIYAHCPNVLFLTAMDGGKYGVFPRLEDWRIEELTGYGFTLNLTLPDVSREELTQYLDEVTDQHAPLCKNGILLSSSLEKGRVLQAYLRHIGHKPRKIIFVDDLHRNIASVAKYCAEHDIEYVGFEYMAWKHWTAPHGPNPQRAQLQLEVLEKEKIWLSDAEAEHRLANLQPQT
ncbi:MAG TPA: DUF2608 domain-containing protein [Gammaproteobacteria bacterium]|nr:DUF2608 domain-containing protein [Gammaproteobacteria bacterium]